MCSLAGMNILILEDEYLVAHELARGFESRGAHVLGPASTGGEGLRLLDDPRTPIAAAVLDIRLADDMVFSVADRLVSRNVPLVFCTGYDRGILPPRFAGARLIQKPIGWLEVARVLEEEGSNWGPSQETESSTEEAGHVSLIRRLLFLAEWRTGYCRVRCEHLVERTLERALLRVDDREDDLPLDVWLWHLLEEELQRVSPKLLH